MIRFVPLIGLGGGVGIKRFPSACLSVCMCVCYSTKYCLMQRVEQRYLPHLLGVMNISTHDGKPLNDRAEYVSVEMSTDGS